ncbi:MAG TPA: type II toxin-antitoxin system PemK/MazF family toxin [Chloroflexota bacterium]|nr:type II toxin-antitoxin system PemK/MazF family toxin [Chloroflexota bacterium]
MTSNRKGDVVLVPFDFTDRSGSKWRPAVVVSSDRYNEATPDVVIASITGNLNAIAHPGDHRIREWQTAGLLRPSLAQTKVATVEASIVGRRLGVLAQADLVALQRGLGQALGLAGSRTAG